MRVATATAATALGLALVATLASLPVFGQAGGPARRTQSGASLPTACVSSVVVKDIFWLNGTGWYVCTTGGNPGTWTLAGPGSSGANLTLSNLTSPTAVNQSLIPGTTATRALGSSTKLWTTLWLSSLLQFGDNSLGYTNGTGPVFFDNTTAKQATFNLQSLTAGRTYTMPDKSGTVAMTSDITGGITNSAGANVLMKSDGTNAVASSISDNGTTITVTEPIATSDGSASAPVIGRSADHTGWFWGSSRVFLALAGVQKLGIYSSGLYLASTHGIFFDSNSTENGSPDLGLTRAAGSVLQIGNGAPGDTKGWTNWGGESRMTADVTNATATMAAMTGISSTLVAGHKYIGEITIKCNNSTAADGIQFDFNSGTATMTSFWAGGGILASGGTDVIGTNISTSLGGAITFTTFTGESIVVLKISMVANAAGTFIPRFAEVAHTTGTATAELGSFLLLNDSPN